MKICLVSFSPPYSIPYIGIYLDFFKSRNIECDVVYWDRDGKQSTVDEAGIRHFSYKKFVNTFDSKLKRYFPYISATRFIRKQIKAGDYDRIVFLQTHCAVACSGLLRKFKKRYIVDIRDFTLENLALYRTAEKAIFKNSFARVISSPDYKSFLPNFEYIVAHNYIPVEAEHAARIKDRDFSRMPLNIACIGNIRFYNMAHKVIDLFANDERFTVGFYGTGADKLREYCDQNGITNVETHDTFEPQRTLEFYEKCDIINNLYGNKNRYVSHNIPNKFYYAAQFEMPILVCPDTFIQKLADKYSLGITVDFDNENAADDVFHDYVSFDRASMCELADEFLNTAKHDNALFLDMLEEFTAQTNRR